MPDELYPARELPQRWATFLSFTHRKEYCRWITEAKKEETRLERLEKAVEILKKGVRTPG
jgi:uncharacterized protein YdeI (YjbR/CyaY-like superfamily)